MFGKKKVQAQATIVADEGHKWASNSASKALQYETYIVEVHPEREAAFRTEVKAWVSWPSKPEVGDTVTVLHEPGTQKVKLQLKGDPRFDADLREAQEKREAAASREELLRMPVQQEPPEPGPARHLP